MDRRLTPANGRVAALDLAGQVRAERYVPGEEVRVVRPVLDLLAAPGGARERQLLMGEAVDRFETREGWAFVRAARDGYCGYVEAAALGEARAATHIVATPATHLYAEDDIKSPDRAHLSFGSRVTVLHELKTTFETPEGFIPKKHLREIDRPFTDPVTVAQMFFGTPYLWGGNSRLGIDCSGLVQAALLACGMPCPGDSDLQESLGRDVADEAPQRGDLWFWKGHVALLVDAETIIHANGHAMAVTYEDARKAALRIEAQGGGPVTHRRRL
ncbi:C40 family peptidase [Limimaricola hongkongensis]|uniref:NLP/P60 family protein n=1 Tax=Limimaricola hongkongensis DSM 17492 TaxID=1122180 RepID=A0A017HFE4_9RHOB|nr:NlpC/P60 family protein [Limimaricola hongkongensis]EYD73046.1 NLP/P60 family protein [Limimaricola hongkongensis DSM 17492]